MPSYRHSKFSSTQSRRCPNYREATDNLLATNLTGEVAVLLYNNRCQKAEEIVYTIFAN